MDSDSDGEGGRRRTRKNLGLDKRRRNKEWQLYWAGHQRFFHQLCCSSKVGRLDGWLVYRR